MPGRSCAELAGSTPGRGGRRWRRCRRGPGQAPQLPRTRRVVLVRPELVRQEQVAGLEAVAREQSQPDPSRSARRNHRRETQHAQLASERGVCAGRVPADGLARDDDSPGRHREADERELTLEPLRPGEGPAQAPVLKVGDPVQLRGSRPWRRVPVREDDVRVRRQRRRQASAAPRTPPPRRRARSRPARAARRVRSSATARARLRR